MTHIADLRRSSQVKGSSFELVKYVTDTAPTSFATGDVESESANFRGTAEAPDRAPVREARPSPTLYFAGITVAPSEDSQQGRSPHE
jgi:hypothetical protein